MQEFFGTVLIPPSVDRELEQATARFPAVNIREVEFIRVCPPSDLQKVRELMKELDPGESEALALALEMGIKAVLMDEAAGRSVATRLGIMPIGVLGILVRAKQRGLIESVSPLLRRLEEEIGFFVSRELRSEIRRRAGETD